MKNKIIVGTILIVFVLFSSMFAGEWTKEQKEVWQNVEAYWKISADRDVEGYLNYFHDDYLGWDYSTGVPTNKADVEKEVRFYMETTEVLFWSLKPVGIKVYGNFAFVHYYFTYVYKDPEGKQQTGKGRWTDILMKQGDKWVLIADHGGQEK